MSEVLAKIMVYSDLHLASKDYGAHRDYTKDSLQSLKTVLEKAEELQPTHIVGLGDFTYGRINKLEYRESVEQILERLNEITSNNHYQIKGNHDVAGYGMTEYEYYISRGVMKPSTNLTFGNFHITMVDYGKINQVTWNIQSHTENEKAINIAFMHDYVMFNDTLMPNYGKAILLDEMSELYDLNHIISGHIHTNHLFAGLITKVIDGQTHGNRISVDYPGCLSRPAYQENMVDESEFIVLLTLYDTGEYDYDRIEINLPPISETFNLEKKAVEKEKKIAKENRVDLSDVVEKLVKHERAIGDPVTIIMSMNGVDERYRLKAIDFLKRGMG